MGKRLNIVPQKCTGCRQCELACAWVQTGTFQPSHSLVRVSIFDEEASYAPHTCLQCDEAWCMNACPVNAIAVDPKTGAKCVIPSLCIGCNLCTLACPFGTVFSMSQDRKAASQSSKAAKCDLCGGQPACVASCPTDAIQLLDTDRTGRWFADWAEHVHFHHVAATADISQGDR